MASFGKRTRNPGYKPGDHWIECEVCGFHIRNSEARKRWDNLIVCPEDYEERHPMDFFRGREDDMAAKGLVRSENADSFVSIDLNSSDPDKDIPDADFS